MAPRPIFTATHPRAVSTAFERVFMTRRDTLKNFHEPFGDAFYFGPEFMSPRFRDDPEYRKQSCLSDTTYKDVLESLTDAKKEGKRAFIKDMAYYLFAPDGQPTNIAPSITGENDVSEPGNPTTIPTDLLRQFHFAFLIRHPRRSIPSYWRCTIPPLCEKNGFTHFMPNEAGYAELVRLFDFLIETGIVDKDQITVVDADDMLDDPESIITQFCDRVGIDFDKKTMLEWTKEDDEYAAKLFEKWNGFHDDALGTCGLQPRTHMQKNCTVESENKLWEEQWGKEAQQIIRQTVEENVPHYEYLKQYALSK